jgi:hypothetical protein
MKSLQKMLDEYQSDAHVSGDPMSIRELTGTELDQVAGGLADTKTWLTWTTLSTLECTTTTTTTTTSDIC